MSFRKRNTELDLANEGVGLAVGQIGNILGGLLGVAKETKPGTVVNVGDINITINTVH